ncbi:acyltransferase family protein [Paraburkholderia phenazinium]|uniref:Peptidoglycan/LPS O-acetylase OafA/YrhL, contains acyltransferase and SGNH-hydrolase domains n=1 Tax=Paraburkholderia phenazinium TaxID=60549 RepID=A0A1G8BMU7_9BURK|nr:acyltransferase [Paraburkholderia phenazinium]SDH34545.1 Peptidoglycan/LPS O-acetylase OafA/YrhL, contains acyltransferase and SGNH-hydrolase domains [Paraburkholderia phenazinium]
MDNRIRGFDGLRAIAVLMVFLQHRLLASSDETGHLGVWIFFALSGFLITGILTAQRRTIETGVSDFFAELKRFLLRRTLRIFPVYYLLLSVLAVLMLLGYVSPQLKGGLPFHFAYLSNIWIGEVLRYWPGPYSHLWSLSIEEQFYLFFAPLLLIAPLRWHLPICYAVFVAGVASMWGMRVTGTPEIVIYTNPLTNFWLLALGGIGGAWLRAQGSLLRAWLARPSSFAALLVGVSLLCATEPHWTTAAGPAVYTLLCTFYGICIAALVCSIACSHSTTLVGLLETPWLASLGRISYGFYLYHNFVPNPARLHRVQALFHGASEPFWVRLGGIVISFLIALLLAKLSWRFIEAPILRRKAQWTLRVANPAAARGAGLSKG